MSTIFHFVNRGAEDPHKDLRYQKDCHRDHSDIWMANSSVRYFPLTLAFELYARKGDSLKERGEVVKFYRRFYGNKKINFKKMEFKP